MVSGSKKMLCVTFKVMKTSLVVVDKNTGGEGRTKIKID